MEMIGLGFLNRRSVRFVKAAHSNATAAACLAMIGDYFDVQINSVQLSRLATESSSEPAIEDIADLASRHDLCARLIDVDGESVDGMKMPVLLEFGDGHFGVVERAAARKIHLHDPLSRSQRISSEALSRLRPVRAAIFEKLVPLAPPETLKSLPLAAIWRQATGLPTTLSQVLVLSLITQVFTLALPYYMQISIDRAVPSLDLNLLAILATGFALFCVINVAAAFLRSFVLLYAGTKLSMTITSNIVRHLFKLPLGWFLQRHTGDILSRFQSIVPLQRLLTEGAIATLLDGILVITTLGLMLYYSTTLAAISMSALLLYCTVRFVTYRIQRRAQEEVIVAAGREQTAMIENLRGISTLRMLGGEEMRHRHWEARLADSAGAGVALARTSIWQGGANSLIFGLENILIIYLAVSYVIEGAGFSIGMVFAFISYKSQFSARSTSFIDQIVAFKMLSLHLERISDIVLSEQDRAFKSVRTANGQLSGRVSLVDVSFRFGDGLPLVLDRASLTIEPGEYIAIRGASGEGKTTLLKILCGLLEPTEGAVLADGADIRDVGISEFRKQIGAVHQDDTLFAGTLADNIAFFDPNLDMTRIMEVARLAAIHEDITQMPGGYETPVGDMGSSLSGGQRQRVLIARSLYRSPRILVLDEGTSHLDPACEAAVGDALQKLSISRIIVAHRPQTLEAADRILELRGGRLHNVKNHTGGNGTEAGARV